MRASLASDARIQHQIAEMATLLESARRAVERPEMLRGNAGSVELTFILNQAIYLSTEAARDIAEVWPSAKDTWGYEEEAQAAANLWGHGLGLAQYDTPVVSRIYSLDHPVVIEPGMSFALETQHGKPLQWGVRLEEMSVVTEEGPQVTTQSPIEKITVVG